MPDADWRRKKAASRKEAVNWKVAVSWKMAAIRNWTAGWKNAEEYAILCM